MILVDRTYDPALPELVVRELWDYLSDDSDLTPGTYEARIDEDSRWYVSIEDDDVVGVYWCHRINHITWQIHTNVRQKYWGSSKAVPHAKQTLPFIFNDTGAEKIIAIIPETAPQVLKYAQAVGFTQEGRRVGSFRKNGATHDEIHLGITGT